MMNDERLSARGRKHHILTCLGALVLALVFRVQMCSAQQCIVYDTDHVRSLQLLVDGDGLLPPVIRLGGHQQLTLSFDYMSHLPQRLIYHIWHCNYMWSHDDVESLFESDWLSGLNGQVIEDYETSFNTTQNYTHYTFTFPSTDLRLRLSGNYCIEVYDEDDYEGENSTSPLLVAQFCVVETGMTVTAQVSSNTDIDFNRSHQQLSYSINYGQLRVVNPAREVHTVVMQNGRTDNAVIDLTPNEQTASGMAFTHRKELIFPAGNEFHKFETIDMHRANLNVDNMRWYEPFYHATIYADKRLPNYTYDEDQNGGFVLRNAEWDDEEITSEYLWVHFTLKSDSPLSDEPVYVCGQWTNGAWDEDCRMEYDAAAGEYRGRAYLKQGYYNYQYRQRGNDGRGFLDQTEGNFYETENEYTIYVYYRAQGGRYDQLVGYRTASTSVK